MVWGHDLTALFTMAGFTRWPLLLCSVTGAALIMERGFYFFCIRLDYPRFSQELFDLLNREKLQDAVSYCQRSSNPVAQIAGIYLANHKNKALDLTLSREGSWAMERVECRIRGLAAITHIAPLLGLLGTVTGLVSAFHEIEISGGNVQAQSLAGGIWEALLSTVIGLMIAIPCMAAYHGFESQADRTARRMKTIVLQLDEFFKKNSPPAFSTLRQEAPEPVVTV